jgi:hypothetical protein
MRKAWLLLLLAPSALVYACSGDNNTNDAGTDATTDVATKPDAAPDTGTDAAKDSGTDAPQQSDASFTLTCFKPADCFDGGGDAAFPPDAGEVCCGTVQTSGTFPSCSFDQAGTACQAPSACATTIGLQSCGTDQVRLCESNTECAEPGYDLCCSTAFGDAGARVHFCGNNTLKIASQGKITCP